jgi:hypothetical protein
MSNNFPETLAKKMLRMEHYSYIIKKTLLLGRNLIYFGLPSSEMLDVKLWKTHLEHIYAIERDADTASEMYRTIGKLGLHKKITVIEHDLIECSKLLALDLDSATLSMNRLNVNEQGSLTRLRQSFFDIVYLDMFGGFLYERSDQTNTNTEIIKNILSHQKQFNKPFSLILTYSLRTGGGPEFDRFNSEFLNELANAHPIEADELTHYYLTESIEGHPLSMRRMRLAIPIHIMSLGRDSFEVSSIKHWIYGKKTFLYHVRIDLKPRLAGSLGVAWPPIDEVRRTISEDIIRLNESENGEIVEEILEAPKLVSNNANIKRE